MSSRSLCASALELLGPQLAMVLVWLFLCAAGWRDEGWNSVILVLLGVDSLVMLLDTFVHDAHPLRTALGLVQSRAWNKALAWLPTLLSSAALSIVAVSYTPLPAVRVAFWNAAVALWTAALNGGVVSTIFKPSLS